MKMYIKIVDTVYTELLDLEFSPQVNLICETFPTNSFSVKLRMPDFASRLLVGQPIKLYDENNVVYALFYITSARLISDEIVDIEAKDICHFLDSVTMPAVFYDGSKDFGDVIEDIEDFVNARVWPHLSIHKEYLGELPAVNGFAPEQTAKERIQYVCFAYGYYPVTVFINEPNTSYNITIGKCPLSLYDEIDPTYIMEQDIKWKPERSDRQFYTTVRLGWYQLWEIFEAQLDAGSYVTDGTRYWLPLLFTIDWHPSGSNAHPENVLEATSNMLITEDQKQIALLNFSLYYANGGLIYDVEFLTGDGVYQALPGEYISFYTGRGREIVYGVVEETDFIFGERISVKAKVRMLGSIAAHKLTVSHESAGKQLGTDEYFLPAGVEYTIGYPNRERVLYPHREIYRPQYPASAIGTMPASDTTVTIEYDHVLDIEADNERMSIFEAPASKVGDTLVIYDEQEEKRAIGEMDDVEYESSILVKSDKMVLTGARSATKQDSTLRIQ